MAGTVLQRGERRRGADGGTELCGAHYRFGTTGRAVELSRPQVQLRELVSPSRWAVPNHEHGALDQADAPFFVRCVKPICRRQG